MDSQFKKLFELGYIGKIEIRNRIVMSPMGTGFCDPDGGYSRRQLEWYAARARGGVGLIEAEACIVEREICQTPRFPSNGMEADDKIPRAHEMTRLVHDYGAKISVQLSIGLGRCLDRVSIESPPVSASAMPAFADPDVLCRPLTVEEINQLVQAFADACERAKWAGFDMVSVHNHNGYLLDQFMSPLWNKRTDEYGGDFERRMKFPIQLIRAARERVGPDFPIGFRIGIDLKQEGARTLEEGIEICRCLEACGVSYLNIDQGSSEAMPYSVPPCYFPYGGWIGDAGLVKEAVGIPVMSSGNCYRPQFAEKILAENKVDFVVMGRPLIADPELPYKAQQGLVQDIRPCTRCNEMCMGGLMALTGAACQVNAMAGREGDIVIRKAEKSKNVIVIGGGPGGMEAARVAALKGHTVTLYEKDDQLGGLLKAGARFPFRSELADLIDYFKRSLVAAGVKVETGKEIDAEFVMQSGADAVVVATGAAPSIPSLPGDAKGRIVSVVELMMEGEETGEKIVVAGGALVGCETALFLAQKGRRVTLVETLPLAHDVNWINRMALIPLLLESGVTVLPIRIEAFSGGVVSGIDLNGEIQAVEADTIVMALDGEPNRTLVDAVRDKVREFYAVGDCVQPRNIGYAIQEGFAVGWRM